MILALLLSVAPAVVQADSPPAQSPIRIELNHEQFRRGDRARVYVEAERDGHLVVLHADPAGRVRVLFPLDPTDDDFVRAGRREEVRGRSGRDAFFVEGDDGSGTVLAALSPDPLRYEAFARNDHWDYRVLGGTSLRDDPLAGLLDIVQRMARETPFEYDAVSYAVGRYVASRSGYGGYGYDGYGYGYPYRYRFGLSFGYPYRFGSYDPFYDPFCYDPFWSWSASCYGYGFGYSGFYYPRSYVYGGTYLGGGFVSRRGGTRFVMPRDRVRIGVPPRPRSESVDGSAAPRRVEPRTRERAANPAPPPSRGRGGSDRPRVSSGGSRGSGSRPSVSRGSSGGSKPASRPSNRPSGGRRRG